MIRTINIVIPDAGPLISLAKSGHLDLLLLFKPEVRILIADAVAHEVTRFAAKYPDAAIIARFIAENAPRVQVEKPNLEQRSLLPCNFGTRTKMHHRKRKPFWKMRPG